jgi:uncharacterized protein with HEPN domain
MPSPPIERRRIESLRDIAKCCDQIDEFLAGYTRERFEQDLRTHNAVLYSLQTLGEAAIRLDAEERRRGEAGLMERLYPDVPWRGVRGISNAIRHRYDRLDDDLIWTTLKGRLHPVREAVCAEIARLQGIDEADEPGAPKPNSA